MTDRPFRYASVCDGIGAAHVAFLPLRWECAWHAEIEPFPSAVVAHRHAERAGPNLGDMTKITDEEIARHGPIDLLVGGTPCQAFSVAGLRKGLADPRGNLTLAFLALARRTGARWLLWENVPGVLSSTSHDTPDPRLPDLDGDDGPRDGETVVEVYDADEVHAFACFLAGLRELGYGFAYASLDAQFFNLAQRRERVFLVACLGDWTAPAAVLLEPSCLRGDLAPSREAGTGVAASVAPSLRAQSNSSHREDSEAFVAHALTAPRGGGQRYDFETETLVTHSLSAEGADASEDGTGRGTPLVPYAPDVAGSLCNNGQAAGSATQQDVENGMLVVTPLQEVGKRMGLRNSTRDGTFGRPDALQRTLAVVEGSPLPFDTTQITSGENRNHPKPGDPCHPLARGAHAPAIAFTCKDSSQDAGEDLAPTLRAMPHAMPHENGGGQIAVAINLRGREGGAAPEMADAASVRAAGGGSSNSYVAVDLQNMRTQEKCGTLQAAEGTTGNRGYGVHSPGAMVRRLTPLECERLQGFPLVNGEPYTLVPIRSKPAKDAPRYKSLGNSWAVPCVVWIAKRLDVVKFLETRR